MKSLPLIIEPEQLEQQLGRKDLLVVDLCKPDNYAKGHIPGAVHLDYSQIVRLDKPRMGLLPDATSLGNIFSSIGLTPKTQVVAYDDEGGGRAARFLWTLDCVGHKKGALLNGGLFSWSNEGHSLEVTAHHPAQSEYPVNITDAPLASRDYILSHLNDPGVVLWDSRSPQEYTGEKRFAERGGHIPGAVNIDWVEVMDPSRNMRLKPEKDLRALLEGKGITTDKTVITYCQTHHRSALTYYVLKVLGYPNIKGYPGSWSDWGNSPDTPIEV